MLSHQPDHIVMFFLALDLQSYVMIIQDPGQILRPSWDWTDNTDWTPDDTLQLTFGEGGVRWELRGSSIASMSIDKLKPIWKVGTSI